MAISQCPRCQEKVTVPAGGLPESKVRCPLCQEEYVLREALELMPPALILLDGPVAERPTYFVPRPAYAGAVAGANDAGFDDSEYGTGGGAALDERAEFGLEPMADQGLETNTDGLANQAPKLKPGKIRKKKAKNPLIEGVKIVGGGVMGIAIAILILFWIPNFTGMKLQRQQRDPANIAAKVAQYAPFLVPEDLRTEPVKSSGSKNGNSKAPPTSNGKVVVKNESPKQPKNDEPLIADDGGLGNLLSTEPKDNGIGKLGFDVPSPVTENKKTNEPTVTEPDPFSLGDPLKPAPTKPEPPATTIVEPKPEKPVAPVASKSPLKTLPELPEDAIEKAQIGFLDAAEAWTMTTPEDTKARFLNLYTTLAKLSETTTLLIEKKELAPAQSEDAKLAVQKVIADEKTARLMDGYPTRWLADTERSNPGVALVGTVKDIKQQGKIWISEIQLASKDERMLTIVSSTNPMAAYKVDEKVVVLGLIVENPAENLNGFEGEAELVVLSGLAFPIKASP